MRRRRRRAKRVLDALFKNEQAAAAGEKKEVEIDARLTVSDREVLEKKDFAQMSAAEIAEAKQAIAEAGAAARRGEDAAAHGRRATAT